VEEEVCPGAAALTRDSVFAFANRELRLLMLVHLLFRVDADLYLVGDRLGFAQQPLENVRSFVALRMPGSRMTSAESRNLIDADL
jgi:hypothetical protein